MNKQRLASLPICVAVLLLAPLCGLIAHAGDSVSASQGYQKPGAPVRLVAKPVVNAEPGDAIALSYQFFAPITAGSATVQVSVDAGLQHDAAETYDFQLPGDDFELNFTATAAKAGVYYVRFMVELNGRLRALGQRIQVGDIGSNDVQKPKGLVGGVMSMPAQETIRKK